MAAQPLPQPQPNPYDLNPQPQLHADSGHIHRFVPFGYTQRCIYCHVHEVLALRAENEDLKKKIRQYEDGFLELYRKAGAKYITLKIIRDIRDICANFIALAHWQDEQRGDDDR